MPFTFSPLNLPEVILIKPKTFKDERGFFFESYHAEDFKLNGIDVAFVQDNHTRSRKGVLRGLHYQLHPKAQDKLIRVVSGSVFDVVVDVRRGSPNFGKWTSVHLSSENQHMLWIPAGFAHGMLALSDHTELLYKVTQGYSPDHEQSIRWNDPELNIQWPIKSPILSDKDSLAPLFIDANINFNY